MIDEQIFEMLNSRFDSLDGKIDKLSGIVEEHCEQDAQYWKKMDAVEAQFSLVKWLIGGVGGSTVLAWLYQMFGKHPH